MADLSDVEDALVTVLTSILYPAGTSQPSLVGSVCRIYRGWPNSTTLNSDLGAGVINVTVCSDNDGGRTTTRYLPQPQMTTNTPGTTARVTSGTISIAGIPLAGDVIGAIVDGASYAYRIQPGDTPAMVAANLALAIQTVRPATVSGTVISIPGSYTVLVRCVADGFVQWENRRQEKDFRMISWCPSPESRDVICSALDAALSQLTFLALPDKTSARIQYKNTMSYDQAQTAQLYRRDLLFCVEYPTINSSTQPAMLFGRSNLDGNITLG